MYDKIFKRVEQKYLLTEEQYKRFTKLIEQHLEKDKFHYSKICNIYFDTKNNDIIINSIEKPVYKEKIRIRSYGIPSMEDTIFLEIKNKYKGTVGKRRIAMHLKEYYEYLKNDKYDDNNQIMKEINYLVHYYNLGPAIFIAYDRLSYKSKEDEQFRITFDFNLRSRRENLELESGDNGEKYFNSNSVIMEIKTLGAIPLWFTMALSKCKIYPTSFSKYGNIYKKEFLEREGETNVG